MVQIQLFEHIHVLMSCEDLVLEFDGTGNENLREERLFIHQSCYLRKVVAEKNSGYIFLRKKKQYENGIITTSDDRLQKATLSSLVVDAPKKEWDTLFKLVCKVQKELILVVCMF